MERGTGKEKVIHIALSKLRDLTYPPQMQTSEKNAQKKNTTPTSPIQTHRFAHSRLVCSLFPLYHSPVTGRIWTHVNSSIPCTSRAHTQRQTSLMLSILIHRTIKKKISTQLPRTQTAKAKTLCVKQMHKATRTLTQLHTKTFLNMLTHSLTGAGHK